MKECQPIQHGRQHFLDFVLGKGTLEQDLSERLLGIFHDYEEKLPAAELTQTCIKKPDQVRVGQVGGRSPVRELCQCDPLSRDNLDGSSANIRCRAFSNEYRAVL